ncbi:MAG: hypothetical protein EBR86_03970 [Planctomycetia bacterium]|nr:hypothetical protein [Planctomycetia bacterium]
MTRSKKLRRDTLGTIEQLERRQTMSASPTVELLPGGLLKVTGTANAETITICRSNYDRSILIARLGIGSGRELGRWNIHAVTSIDASMGSGNDRLDIDFGNTGSLNAVKVNMGTGSNEEVRVTNTSLQTFDLDAKAGVNTTLRISGGTIASKAFADFGSGQGDDRVFVDGATVNRLELRMGDGKDTVDAKASVLGDVAIDMGAGNDTFSTSNTTIASGTVNGGSGRDSLRSPRYRDVRFVNFEI